MPTRRDLLGGIGGCAVSITGCLGDGSDDGEPATTVTGDAGGSSLALSSPAFADGESIPVRYTADGEDVSPPLRIAGVPDGAASLALALDDPDAPGGTFVHWLLWNLPPGTAEIPEGVPATETVADLDGARQGTNGFGDVGYGGPAPPEGDDPHAYRFTLYALDTILELEAGAERPALGDAMEGGVLATARLVGEYGR